MSKSVTRRLFLKNTSIGFILLSFLKGLRCRANKQKPNILWLIADDMSPDLGCYGNNTVYTPNIDNLAKQGVLYTHAFASASTCAPMRSALITGKHAISIGAHHQRNRQAILPDTVDLFIRYLKDAGYYCVNTRPDLERKGKTDYMFQWKTKARYEDEHDWANRKPGQPFFAQVQFRLPHRPFERDPDRPINPQAIKLPPYYPDDPVVRIDYELYLESIQLLDRKVGEILHKLSNEGDADNTLVFFFSDQGRPFPRDKQFLYDGGIHIPLILRWPGQFKAGSINNDLISTIDFAPTCLNIAGVEIPDYMHGQPFLKDTAPKRDYIFAARDRVDDAVDRIRCVRSKRFKYIRNFMANTPWNKPETYMLNEHPTLAVMMKLFEEGKLNQNQAKWLAPVKPKEELYDVVEDPFEFNNVASDPGFQDILVNFRKELNQWLEKMDDRGAEPEDKESLMAAKKTFEKMKTDMIKDRNLSEDDLVNSLYRYWKRTLEPTKKNQRD